MKLINTALDPEKNCRHGYAAIKTISFFTEAAQSSVVPSASLALIVPEVALVNSVPVIGVGTEMVSALSLKLLMLMVKFCVVIEVPSDAEAIKL